MREKYEGELKDLCTVLDTVLLSSGACVIIIPSLLCTVLDTVLVSSGACVISIPSPRSVLTSLCRIFQYKTWDYQATLKEF